MYQKLGLMRWLSKYHPFKKVHTRNFKTCSKQKQSKKNTCLFSCFFNKNTKNEYEEKNEINKVREKLKTKYRSYESLINDLDKKTLLELEYIEVMHEDYPIEKSSKRKLSCRQLLIDLIYKYPYLLPLIKEIEKRKGI